MTEEIKKSLSLKLGAVLSIFAIASGLLVYGVITEASWVAVAESSIKSILTLGG